ncbi:hypothetical protein [Cytobacillus horneckiae]|uniref:Uncharacterized protein n=1 Tax=Cytobacillus horneckiae TaxID=549687 RepID=A0A2N0ZFC4_9BACI|nr:hypothetical protein [Cytobacillus horneckiae]MEC1155658.1 hypothetical protein [Cytobacillus horneckiae]MED2936976.1 hypothetical protein [Cytobacillus horneckiae]PKG28209.1 hypothetical protein CWS20_15310 [Cytobacillus horneckiae]
MIQERINELTSGILKIENGKIHVMGFKNEKLLLSHLDNGTKNWSSIGLYDLQKVNFQDIKNDALVLVIENDEIVGKYQYTSIYKDVIKYENDEGKNASMVFTIRRSKYSEHFQFVSEKITETFENKESIINFTKNRFGINLEF